LNPGLLDELKLALEVGIESQKQNATRRAIVLHRARRLLLAIEGATSQYAMAIHAFDGFGGIIFQ
jgi:hypothetical protein